MGFSLKNQLEVRSLTSQNRDWNNHNGFGYVWKWWTYHQTCDELGKPRLKSVLWIPDSPLHTLGMCETYTVNVMMFILCVDDPIIHTLQTTNHCFARKPVFLYQLGVHGHGTSLETHMTSIPNLAGVIIFMMVGEAIPKWANISDVLIVYIYMYTEEKNIYTYMFTWIYIIIYFNIKIIIHNCIQKNLLCICICTWRWFSHTAQIS